MTQPTPEERLGRLLPLVRRLAEDKGRPDLARAVPERADHEGPLPRVVVAGETKRGKSSLVNALLGRPGLSPVGVDVTTSCYLTFTRGTPESATALLAGRAQRAGSSGAESAAELDLEVRRHPIALDAIADYASVQGRVLHARTATEDADADVVGIEAVLDAPVLDGILLIDTPGVGGLVEGHGAITVRMLEQAEALLFILDGSGPILEPEVEFLAEAQARVGAILVVVTKSDAYPAERVQRLIEESRANLDRRERRLADLPFVTVSARRAELAASPAAHGAAADTLRSLSGLSDVQRWLQESVRPRAAGLRKLTAARAAQRVLMALRAAEDQTPAALAGDPTRRKELEAEEQRLQPFLSDPAAVRVAVSHQIQRMRMEPRTAFDEDMRRLRDDFRERVTTSSSETLATLPQELEAAISAAAAARLQELADLGAAVGRRVAERLGYEGMAEEAVRRARAEGDWTLQGPGRGARDRSTAALGLLGMVGLGNMVGGSVATLALSTGIVASSVLTGGVVHVLGLGVAAGLGWWRVRTGDRQQQRAQLQSWVSQAIADSRALFATTVERVTVEMQQWTEVTLPELIRERSNQIKAVRQELQALDAAGAAARASAAAAHSKRLSDIDSLLRPANEVVQALALER
jgi:GTP-binding protein EngB required for normal cell division